jgi:transcriptional regulator with XRE-family HTH domain
LRTDTYDYIFKKMVDYLQIKFSTLAEAIGYDVSYVSKWYNGARLPTSKRIDVINQKIADIMADEAIKPAKKDNFALEFAINSIHTKEDLSFQIYTILSQAYRNSVTKKNIPVHTDIVINGTKIIMGHAECLKMLQDSLKSKLESIEEIPDLLITGEFCELTDIQFWSLFDSINFKAPQCNIKVNLNLQKLQAHVDCYCDSMYRCLNTLFNCNITLYENKLDAYKDIIVLKNKFAIQYTRNTEGFIDFCSISLDPLQIQAIYEKCTTMFAEQTRLLMPKDTLGMKEFGYRDIFFTSDKFFYFMVHGMELMLPQQVFDSISTKAAQGLYLPATPYWVERMRVIFRTDEEKTAMKILIPTNSIIRYLENGHIYVTEIYYQLTPEERKLHIKKILDVITKNPKIKISALYSMSGKSSYYNFTNVSFYSNYSSAFFKKNPQYLHKGTPPITLVNHPVLLDCFHQFFNHMMELPNCHEYSAEELTMLCDKYQSLIEQTIQLGEVITEE